MADASGPATYDLSDDEVVPIAELVDLYTAVGWLIYAADPDALARAVDRSTLVVTARDDEGQLVGLARCLSDDVSIMYLQDVLIHPDHRRRSLGSILVGACLRRFDHVRQKVLLTDDEQGQHEFYRSLGYRDINDIDSVAVHCFAQLPILDASADDPA